MKKTTAVKIAGILLPAALSLAIGAPALALSVDVGAAAHTDDGRMYKTSTTATAGVDANLNAKGLSFLDSLGVKLDDSTRASIKGQGIDAIKARADAEITRRVASLNELNTRVQAMTHVSATTKSTIATSITNEVATLNNLKATIDASTDLATIKVDTQSITNAYRVYMLVVPQTRVLAAADKSMTVSDMMSAMSAKLQVRITEAQTAGKDVTSMNASLADMNAKSADAKVQAQAAISAVATLTPDNGDKVKMQANETALKNARISLQNAENDLKAAQKDSKSITAALKSTGVKADGSVKLHQGDKDNDSKSEKNDR